MKIIYYSEKLNETFDTQAELEQAEAAREAELAAKKEAAEKAKADRSARAKEIEAAYAKIVEAEKVLSEAQNNYKALRNKFIEEYGSFHMTVHKVSPINEWFGDLFNTLFK